MLQVSTCALTFTLLERGYEEKVGGREEEGR